MKKMDVYRYKGALAHDALQCQVGLSSWDG